MDSDLTVKKKHCVVKDKPQILLLFVCIFLYLIPQRTAHFFNAVLYYNTIVNIIYNLNFSRKYVSKFQFIKIQRVVIINVDMINNYFCYILIRIIVLEKLLKINKH
jgi:hypothetical protein